MHKGIGLYAKSPQNSGENLPGLIVDIDDVIVAPVGIRAPQLRDGGDDGNAPDPNQVARQIKLRALTGLLFPKMSFSFRPLAPHQYEDGQNPQ